MAGGDWHAREMPANDKEGAEGRGHLLSHLHRGGNIELALLVAKAFSSSKKAQYVIAYVHHKV